MPIGTMPVASKTFRADPSVGTAHTSAEVWNVWIANRQQYVGTLSADRAQARERSPMTRMNSFALVLSLAACGDDPLTYSDSVAINLKAESGAVNGTAISDEKGITTESGNPYGAFMTEAANELGRDPGRIEIDALTLTLGAQSTGVTALEQVYTGDVDVLFLMNDTNNTYNAGRITNPTGTGPLPVGVLLDSDAVSDQDWPKYLGGSFKVIIRGTAATDFASKGAKADLQLAFTFAAYE
jgi:hypothetical protein